MMVNIWYPAKAEDARDSKDGLSWPADEEASGPVRRARGGCVENRDGSDENVRRDERDESRRRKKRSASRKQTEKTARHQAPPRLRARRRGRAQAETRALAGSHARDDARRVLGPPGWAVDYFRLVKMEAIEDAPVADPPRARTRAKSTATADEEDGAEELETESSGFPVVLFHSFTGVKEQNSALLQEIASWGHVVVAVDHPHDAAGGFVPGREHRRFPRVRHLEGERTTKLVAVPTRARAAARARLSARAGENSRALVRRAFAVAGQNRPLARRVRRALVRRRRRGDARADGPPDHRRRSRWTRGCGR